MITAPATLSISPQTAPASAPDVDAAALLALQALALRHERFAPAAVAVLAELAHRLSCERVTVGWHVGGQSRLAALNTAPAEGDSAPPNLVRAIEAAMDEAIDERSRVVYPLPPGTAGGMVQAHAALMQLNGGLSVCSVPVVQGERLLGAMVFERRKAFDALSLDLVADAAQFVGPLLDMQHRLDAPVGGRLAERLRPRGLHLGARLGGYRRALAAMLLLPLLALVLVPVRDEVVAPARIEGAAQHVVSSPLDGFIAQARVRPGDQVRAGDLLVQLDERDAALQRDRSAAEASQADKQYREAQAREDQPATAMARARLDQAEAQRALAERDWQRMQIVAPIDGVVIGGDLSQSTGMPVTRGQALLTLAPALQLKVVAEVDEQDLPGLQPGLAARVLFAAGSSDPASLRLTRVSPVATVSEGRNVFEVEGLLNSTGQPSAWRPGQRGIARIERGHAPLAVQWWREASQLLRRLYWRLIG